MSVPALAVKVSLLTSTRLPVPVTLVVESR